MYVQCSSGDYVEIFIYGYMHAGSSLESGTIKMASRYGPCSPHRHHRAKRNSSSGEFFQNEKAKEDTMEYYFTVGLGTPKTDYKLFVDTGSDITWVRCKPCSKGCESSGPLFDPSKSSTFVNGSCRSGGNKSDFNSSYADDSSAKGYWGCDTLTIEKSNNVVYNFQFGCAQEIQDTVGDNFGNDTGILGLGSGDLSLTSQANFKIFGYCIPKTNSKLGYFAFGREAAAMMSSSKPQFTPLLNQNSQHYYAVDLIGISVAGKKLAIQPSVFTSTGTIVDSGTSLTQLPQEAYSALTTAFNETMASKYPAAQSNNAVLKLDTCYNVDGFDKIYVPYITFHFTGISKEEIDVKLRPSGIVLTPPSEPNLLCLGFTQKDDGFAIIGNHQQRQMGVFYDLQEKRIGFGTNNCAN